jgi:hypothetical protein
MKHLLGILSKKTSPDPADYAGMFEDFSLHGRRKIITHNVHRLLIATFNSPAEQDLPYAKSKDGANALFLAGHILNREHLIRKYTGEGITDPDKLREVFVQDPGTFLSDANGHFCLACYDPGKNELLLANDAFGSFPCFIYEDEDVFIFCNEFEPITRYRHFNGAMDHDAVAEYFALGSPIAGKTFFRNIRNLPPATIMKIGASGSEQTHYDVPEIAINHSGSIGHFAEQLVSVFHKATQSRARLNGTKSYMLTAGLDTRFIISNLSHEQRMAGEFVTFLTPGLDPAKDKDIIIAKMIAEKLGLQHKVFEYRPWSVQWVEDFNLALFDVWRERYPQMIMAGLYGGEFLSGGCFGIIPEMKQASKRTNIFSRGVFRKKEILPFETLNKAWLKGIRNPFETLEEERNKIKAENRSLRFAIDYMNRGFFTQIYGGLRAKWADPYNFSARMLTPFLDRDFLNVLLSIPSVMLTDDKQPLYNTLYSKHLPELNQIPTSNIAFARTKGNCISFIEEGAEPRNARQFMNAKALDQYLKDDQTWQKNIYDRNAILASSADPASAAMKAFFDFESWHRKYIR